MDRSSIVDTIGAIAEAVFASTFKDIVLMADYVYEKCDSCMAFNIRNSISKGELETAMLVTFLAISLAALKREEYNDNSKILNDVRQHKL